MLAGVDIFAIKVRNIRTGAQHTAKTFFVAASSVSTAKQVAVNADIGFWKKLAYSI